jgi:hypothetical protein
MSQKNLLNLFSSFKGLVCYVSHLVCYVSHFAYEQDKAGRYKIAVRSAFQIYCCSYVSDTSNGNFCWEDT